MRAVVIPWGLPIEQERRNRIRVAIYAYAYELRDESLISDQEYDTLARSIQPNMRTGNDAIDKFFSQHYSADTGLWIHQHPQLERIAELYARYYIQ